MVGKRRHEAIDLTREDAAASSSQATRPPPGDGVSQSQRDIWLDQSQEGEADDIIINSQDGDNEAMV